MKEIYYGKTPLQTFSEAKHIAQAKMIGKTKFPFQKQIESELGKVKSKEMTISRIEGVR